MFRFTIRELLILTVCVSVVAGWWMDRRRLMALNRYLTYESADLRADYTSVRRTNRELRDTVRKFQEAMSVQAPGPSP